MCKACDTGVDELPARKMKVDVVDGSGNHYTVTFSGNVTRDKAIRLLEIVELLGGIPEKVNESSQALDLSKFDKIRLIIEKHFPILWFSSGEVQAMYEQELKTPISLSTVSTYLARLTERGILVKSSKSGNMSYRIMTQVAQNTLNLTKDNK